MYIPQSEHSYPVRTLIISSVLIQFKPVDIAINLRHPLFLITSLPSPFCLSAILIDYWFLTCFDSCLRLLPAPWYFCISAFGFWTQVVFWLFFCLRFGHYKSLSLWLPVNEVHSLYLPWSASDSLSKRNIPGVFRNLTLWITLSTVSCERMVLLELSAWTNSFALHVSVIIMHSCSPVTSLCFCQIWARARPSLCLITLWSFPDSWYFPNASFASRFLEFPLLY